VGEVEAWDQKTDQSRYPRNQSESMPDVYGTDGRIWEKDKFWG